MLFQDSKKTVQVSKRLSMIMSSIIITMIFFSSFFFFVKNRFTTPKNEKGKVQL